MASAAEQCRAAFFLGVAFWPFAVVCMVQDCFFFEVQVGTNDFVH